jgi:hypothetical protein
MLRLKTARTVLPDPAIDTGLIPANPGAPVADVKVRRLESVLLLVVRFAAARRAKLQKFRRPQIVANLNISAPNAKASSPKANSKTTAFVNTIMKATKRKSAPPASKVCALPLNCCCERANPAPLRLCPTPFT